jgi:hypothetical protein
LSAQADNFGLLRRNYNMLSKILFKKSLTAFTAMAVWCVYSMVAFAAPKDITGEISVTGQVTINGQNAVSNSSVVSGSTITTGANSTATISLGKVGRVEVSPDSSIMLKFSDNNITGVLSTGDVRVSNAIGIAATITTKDAAVIADAGQANNFEVGVECSHTHVNSFIGLVTMRSGTTDKQISAGTDGTAGNPSQAGCKPCVRPGGATAPLPLAGIGAGALAGILLGIGGAVIGGVVLGSGSGDGTTIGGGVVVVSPVR